MSRVDDAMRRAAAEAMRTHHSAAGTTATDVTALDADALAREPFPIEEPSFPVETPERQPLASQTRELAAPAQSSRHNSGASDAASSAERLFDRFDPALAEKLVVDPRISAGSREQYRRLAGILHDAQAVSGLKVVMIASATAGEGKTLTAANLALTLSGSYRKRVLLIDADFRRPAVHQVFRIDTSYGLADGLEAANESKLVVRQVSPTLAVLPAGRPTLDPMAALISERMRRLINEAKETFEWVIIDTPPLVLLPDANLLASMVDGAVLVIRASSTSHELLKRAVEAIGRSRIVGAVLNRASVSSNGHYAYDDYYSSALPRRAQE